MRRVRKASYNGWYHKFSPSGYCPDREGSQPYSRSITSWYSCPPVRASQPTLLAPVPRPLVYLRLHFGIFISLLLELVLEARAPSCFEL